MYKYTIKDEVICHYNDKSKIESSIDSELKQVSFIGEVLNEIGNSDYTTAITLYFNKNQTWS